MNGADPTDNCFREFDYAGRVKPGKLIPCVVEPRMRNPDAWKGGQARSNGTDGHVPEEALCATFSSLYLADTILLIVPCCCAD